MIEADLCRPPCARPRLHARARSRLRARGQRYCAAAYRSNYTNSPQIH